MKVRAQDCSAHSASEALNPVEQLKQKVVNWTQEPSYGENRVAVLREIESFLNDENRTSLHFSGFNLSSLPPIFDSEVIITRLTVLDLSENAFVELPSTLGCLTNLEELFLSGMPSLKRLPLEIGDLGSLKVLHLCQVDEDNDEPQLDPLEIPDSFKNLQQLEELVISGYKFEKIPTVFYSCHNLKSLTISEGNLTKVSRRFCESFPDLEYLDLSGNAITEISDAIGDLSNLRQFILVRNSLRTLPETVFNLSGDCEINLNLNQLTRDYIQKIEGAASGPVFSNYTNEDDEELLDMVEHYLRDIYTFIDKERFLDIDSLVEGEDPENSEFLENLKNWLSRLTKKVANIDDEKNIPFYKKVIAILETAAADPDYKELFKAVLEDANSTCGDRIVLSVLQLGLKRQLNNLDLNNTANVAEFLKRGVFAMTLLEEVATSKIEELTIALKAKLKKRGVPEELWDEKIEDRIDPLELYLGFPVALKTKLKLPLDVDKDKMQFFDVSDIKESDLEQAEAYVLERINNEESFINFLVSDLTWRKVLRKRFYSDIKSLEKAMTQANDFEKGATIFKEGLKDLTKLLLQVERELEIQEPIAKRLRHQELKV